MIIYDLISVNSYGANLEIEIMYSLHLEEDGLPADEVVCFQLEILSTFNAYTIL